MLVEEVELVVSLWLTTFGAGRAVVMSNKRPQSSVVSGLKYILIVYSEFCLDSSKKGGGKQCVDCILK